MKEFDVEQNVELLKRGDGLVNEVEFRLLGIYTFDHWGRLFASSEFDMWISVISIALGIWYVLTKKKRLVRIMFDIKKGKKNGSSKRNGAKDSVSSDRH